MDQVREPILTSLSWTLNCLMLSSAEERALAQRRTLVLQIVITSYFGTFCDV